MDINLRLLIREIIEKTLISEDDDYIFDYYDRYESISGQIFSDFKDRKKMGYTRIPWRVVPFGLLKITWENFVKYGFVPERFYKNLDKIERIMTMNVIKLDITTYLFGHSPNNPKEDFEVHGIYIEKEKDVYIEIDIIGNPKQITMFDYPSYQFLITVKNNNDDSEIKQIRVKNASELDSLLKKMVKLYNILDIISENNFFEKYKESYIQESEDEFNTQEDFFDWVVDKNGTSYVSDYGLEPLQKLLYELKLKKTPEERLVVIDKMLNVSHQRSDLASWFVEGGSKALSNLSGMEVEMES